MAVLSSEPPQDAGHTSGGQMSIPAPGGGTQMVSEDSQAAVAWVRASAAKDDLSDVRRKLLDETNAAAGRLQRLAREAAIPDDARRAVIKAYLADLPPSLEEVLKAMRSASVIADIPYDLGGCPLCRS